MARTLISSETQLLAGQGLGHVELAEGGMQAGDTVNGNYCKLNAGDVLFMRNTDTGAQTVDIVQVAGREGRVVANPTTISLAADEMAFFEWPAGGIGWHGAETAPDDGDDGLQVDASNDGVLFEVIRKGQL
jgi:hypothetical protein